MIIKGMLYTTNAVASQLDIGNDIKLDSWEPTDVVDMKSLKALSPSIHATASQYISQGYAEKDVVVWAQTAIADIIEQRTAKHMSGPAHKIPETRVYEHLKKAATQCANKLDL
jgi:hypothetical protein